MYFSNTFKPKQETPVKPYGSKYMVRSTVNRGKSIIDPKNATYNRFSNYSVVKK